MDDILEARKKVYTWKAYITLNIYMDIFDQMDSVQYYQSTFQLSMELVDI